MERSLTLMMLPRNCFLRQAVLSILMALNELSAGMLSSRSLRRQFDINVLPRSYEQVAGYSDRTFIFRDVA
jgi:hypothetical protein